MRIAQATRVALAALLLAGVASAQDAAWPQLQHDAARTGRTSDTVKPPYRARWIWFGPDWVLRNQLSAKGDPQWKDDLTSGEGKSLRMPAEVPFSFAGSMQPIVAGKNVFVGDAQGKVYALNLDDGASLWTADNPGGTFWSGVADGEVVAFASVLGYLTGYSAKDGKQLWQLDTGKSITSAPLLDNGIVYAASQSGRVYAVNMADGKLIWTSDHLGAPIQGGLCLANSRIYVGTEAMEAISLDAKDSKVLAKRKLMGQSFRMLWPVAVKDRVLFTTAGIVCVGSEYVNDAVLAGRPPGQQMGWVRDAKSGYPDAAAEDQAKRQWIAGAGKSWETCFALKADTLDKDYIIATGATEGCGNPPDPPAIDSHGRPLLWWATAFPTLTKPGTFGSSYAMDLSTFDMDSGRRILIDNKGPDGKTRLSGQTTESDNLYALSVGGDILYLRQNFRGTFAINLTNSSGSFISAVYRVRDGGTWAAALNYAPSDKGPVRVPRTPSAIAGRAAPAIAAGRLIFAENFAITCVETAQPEQRP